jgi:hypothetical protein
LILTRQCLKRRIDDIEIAKTIKTHWNGILNYFDSRIKQMIFGFGWIKTKKGDSIIIFLQK